MFDTYLGNNGEKCMEKQKPALELEEQDKEQNPIIQLKGLGKQFKTSNGPVTALDDIHLEINPGEIFGIIGDRKSVV